MNTRAADGAVDLPRVDAGITVVRPPVRRRGAIHQLVISERIHRDGSAYWVDAGNAASSYSLYEVAPSAHLVDSINVARAFTAFQHLSLVQSLPAEIALQTELVVVPNIDILYEECDLPIGERLEMVESALAILEAVAESAGAAVICSVRGEGEVAEAVCSAADHQLEVEATGLGLSFTGDEFETHGYWCDGLWQTTIPYWVDIFGSVEETRMPTESVIPTTLEV